MIAKNFPYGEPVARAADQFQPSRHFSTRHAARWRPPIAVLHRYLQPGQTPLVVLPFSCQGVPKRKKQTLEDLIRDSEKLREESLRVLREAKQLRHQIEARRNEPIGVPTRKFKPAAKLPSGNDLAWRVEWPW